MRNLLRYECRFWKQVAINLKPWCGWRGILLAGIGYVIGLPLVFLVKGQGEMMNQVLDIVLTVVAPFGVLFVILIVINMVRAPVQILQREQIQHQQALKDRDAQILVLHKDRDEHKARLDEYFGPKAVIRSLKELHRSGQKIYTGRSRPNHTHGALNVEKVEQFRANCADWRSQTVEYIREHCSDDAAAAFLCMDGCIESTPAEESWSDIRVQLGPFKHLLKNLQALIDKLEIREP